MYHRHVNRCTEPEPRTDAAKTPGGDRALALLQGYSASIQWWEAPDEQFRAGRSKVLHAQLNGPALYRSPLAHAHWEASARAYLNAEIDRLGGAGESTRHNDGVQTP